MLIYKNRSNFRSSTPKTKISNHTVGLDKTTVKTLRKCKLRKRAYSKAEFMFGYIVI